MRRVKRAESILPENKHVWMQGNKSNPLHQAKKRAVSEEWDRPPEKFWRMGEEDVTMKQDITATSGASSSIDRPGNEPQMYKQKI